MAKEIKLSPEQTIIKKMNAHLKPEHHLKFATETTTGKTVVVDQKGLIPNNGQVADIYYPAFFKVLTDLSINRFVRESGTSIFGKLFPKKLTVNGLKRTFYSAYGNIYDYSATITIDDFNATNPAGYSQTWGIDFEKYVKLVKPSVSELVASFNNPSQTGSWVDNLVASSYETLKLFVLSEQTKIILDTTDSSLASTGVHTITVDINGLDYEKVLKLIAFYKDKMRVTSNELLNLTDKKVVYSANPATDITEIWESEYNAGLMAETSKTWFQNSPYEMYKSEKVSVPFTSIIKNVATAATFQEADVANFKLALVDNRKLEEIYQLKANWSFVLPKLQSMDESHYWFGFTNLPNVPMIVFKDLPPVPFKTKEISNGITKKLKDTQREEVVQAVAETVGQTTVVSGKDILAKIEKTEQTK